MTQCLNGSIPLMRHFEEQLQELFQRIVLMGTLAESMIQTPIASLVKRNDSLVEDVFLKEDEVNALQVEVDDRAVRLTAQNQPMARDARFLFMASRIGGELERIADQSVNICQNTTHALESPPIKTL